MPLLSVEHVGKTHFVGPYEKRVLVDVSLTMRPGDLFGVWGPQRSGKSTLLRLAAGLETPDVGVIRFDGVDLANMSKEQRDALRLTDIGLVRREGPQSQAFTVLDHVAVPLFKRCKPREARDRAMAMLKTLDVAECHDARWHHLSDCEKALVSLARGLVREPRLLLVDDPTSGLDPHQENEVVDLLRKAVVQRSVAVLMTSSVLATVSKANEAFSLSDGCLLPITDASRSGGDVIEFRRGDQRG